MGIFFCFIYSSCWKVCGTVVLIVTKGRGTGEVILMRLRMRSLVCVYVCVCMHVYVGIYVCVHVWMSVYVYLCICVSMCVRVCMCGLFLHIPPHLTEVSYL